MISPEDYRLVQILESNPLMPFSEFAAELGISWPTAKKRVNELKNKGVIRTPMALCDHERLGLCRISFIWALKNRKSLLLIEKLCDIHPYTVYRCRGYGEGFILFVQFYVPPEAISLMSEFSIMLKEQEYLSDTKFLESSGINLETFPNINYFNYRTNEWNFDWNNWTSLVSKQSQNIKQKKISKISFKDWEPIDFEILRSLTANAERKQADLMREFNLSRTEIHRRYSRVYKNLVSSVRLRYNRIIFNLVNTNLFWIPKPDIKTRNQFFNLMKGSPPPFRMELDILKNDGLLLWAGAIPPIHEHRLAFSLWHLFKTFETYTLDTSVESAVSYKFYPKNFDFETWNWINDRNYIIEQPLKELEKIKLEI
ncbi:MAG: winged helix-turn-helix transcriptional regulator [Candidatus Hermodarchaeota archaeon]